MIGIIFRQFLYYVFDEYSNIADESLFVIVAVKNSEGCPT